ncbi:MAG: amino acid permease [Candidatus Neomarinimicrobiota bacterium]|nr:MAG: amino acid permease [Candidatus Neomarinimicrobiota bacterium]
MDKSLAKSLGLWDLVLMNIVAIVGLRWLLTAAQTGYASLLLWVLALVFFFIPQGYTIFLLSRLNGGEGGIYLWARDAFGPFAGFITGWCYWINNLIYYPTLLMFLGGNALYLFGSRWTHLTESSLYIGSFSILVLTLIVLLNVRGLSLGKWLHNIGGAGIWIPMLFLIGLAAYSLETQGLASPPAGADFLPDLGQGRTWAFWSTMCFGFAGLELMSLVGDEIRRPRSSVPRAILLSGTGITLIYILGTLALLVALPAAKIGLLDGIVGAVQSLGDRLAIPHLGWITALFITLSGLGGVSAWIAGVARVPFVIGLDRYLPLWIADVHPRWGTPYKSLLLQGGLTAFFILLSVLGSTIREAYLVLLEAEIILYFIPYLFMFAAGWKLIREWRGRLAAASGGLTTFLAMVFALVPPEGSRVAIYETKIAVVTLGFIGVGLGLYRRARRLQSA